MLLRDITSDHQTLREGLTWAKSGANVVRKYRCMGGARQGRVVSSPQQCYAPFDLKKRAKMRMLKARMGNRMVRKTKKTKRTSPASRRVAQMNKSTSRKR